MSRKKSLIAVSLLLIGLIIFVSQKDEKLLNKEHKTIVLNENSQKKSLPEKPIKPLGLKNDLNDLNIKVEVRIKSLINLDLSIDEASKIEELVSFINSDHPSLDALDYQKEGALRIYAIRKLSEELSLEAFSKVALEIENHSKDEMIKSVASQALNSKKVGRNYFEDTVKTIDSMTVP